jgi:hypothetical protein
MLKESILCHQTFRWNVEIDILTNFYQRSVRQLADTFCLFRSIGTFGWLKNDTQQGRSIGTFGEFAVYFGLMQFYG